MKGGKVCRGNFFNWRFLFSIMNRSWISLLLVAALLGLLTVLAALQYQWLSQISSDERERLQKRLETDTQRFAEDFNRELQVAYFSFQFDDEAWRQKSF